MSSRPRSDPPVSPATSDPALPLENDRALLDAFRRGEREALAKVYFQYVDAVARLVRFGVLIDSHGVRIPGVREADAERELVHDVFVRAFGERARLSYDGIRPFRAYLLRIARNLLIDRHRARGHVIALQDGLLEGALELDAAEPAAGTPDDAEDELHWQRLTAAAHEYVAGLTAELREFVRLRFEEELPQHEVADRMKVSRRRVRTLERRAQTGLCRFLKRRKLQAD
jgi:RNA polymerase sigma-70 factor, ECF subfamily